MLSFSGSENLSETGENFFHFFETVVVNIFCKNSGQCSCITSSLFSVNTRFTAV